MKWKAISVGAVLIASAGVAYAAFTPYTVFSTLTGNEFLILGPVNSSPQYVLDGTLAIGHLPPPTGAAAPVLSSCGTNPTIAGTDAAGTVTMGTGSPTGCVITFVTAYKTAPNCVVTWQATPLAAQSYALATTTITLTQTGTSSNVVNYACSPQAGG